MNKEQFTNMLTADLTYESVDDMFDSDKWDDLIGNANVSVWQSSSSIYIVEQDLFIPSLMHFGIVDNVIILHE